MYLHNLDFGLISIKINDILRFLENIEFLLSVWVYVFSHEIYY